MLEEDRFLFEILRSHFGNPVDIPWFGAAHDGYPFCPTLNGYTDLRQEDKATTAYDDVGLWVGAMTFGLLEALFGIKIPEAELLSPSSNAGPAPVSSHFGLSQKNQRRDTGSAQKTFASSIQSLIRDHTRPVTSTPVVPVARREPGPPMVQSNKFCLRATFLLCGVMASS